MKARIRLSFSIEVVSQENTKGVQSNENFPSSSIRIAKRLNKLYSPAGFKYTKTSNIQKQVIKSEKVEK